MKRLIGLLGVLLLALPFGSVLAAVGPTGPTCSVSDSAPTCEMTATVDGHIGYTLSGDIEIDITRDGVALGQTCINGTDAGDQYVGDDVLTGDVIDVKTLSPGTSAAVFVVAGAVRAGEGTAGVAVPCIVANDIVDRTDVDSPLAVTLNGNDLDGSALTYTVDSGSLAGSLSGAAPNLTYTPPSGFQGVESFTYTASDGTFSSAAATVTITTDNLPLADSQVVTTTEDVAKAITLTGSDANAGDTLTFSIIDGPSHGSLGTSVAPNLTYTPEAGFAGSDQILFEISDGTLKSAVATVNITVVTADGLAALDQSVSTNKDVPANITLTTTDNDSDALTYTILDEPQNGLLTTIDDKGTPATDDDVVVELHFESETTNSAVKYTPNSGYAGADSFSFKARQGNFETNIGTVTLDVVNAAPVAADQSVETMESVPVDITLVATDADANDSLSYLIVDQPAHGTLQDDGSGDVVYAPEPGYSGPDSFTFSANDGTVDSNIATVSINVTSAGVTPPGTTAGGCGGIAGGTRGCTFTLSGTSLQVGGAVGINASETGPGNSSVTVRVYRQIGNAQVTYLTCNGNGKGGAICAHTGGTPKLAAGTVLHCESTATDSGFYGCLTH